MRRVWLLGTLVAIGALSIMVSALQQQPARMEVATQSVKSNLFMMTGGGGNSAVFVGSDGVTVVDTKNPGWGQPLIDAIRKVTDKPIVRIINTHTHFDHVSGNVEFPATVDIVTHENTKRYIDEGNAIFGVANPPPKVFTADNRRGKPTRTFKDRMTVGRGADRIDLYYFGRAHTGGDAWVVFAALGVMHAGDAFHTKDLPIMDRNNGGSGVEFPKTLANAYAATKAVDTIINGHHPTTTTPADLKTQSEFVADFVSYVQGGKKAGRSLDEVVKGWQTPAKYSGYAMPQPARVQADAQVIWDETK